MVRFIHTADWQMGFEAKEASDIGNKLREARFETARRIIDLAHEKNVDFILIAGDLFENNLVADSIVRKVVEILGDADPIPVFVLPGNHDPYSPESVYRRRAWEYRKSNVKLLLEPVEIRNAILLPSPLFQKKSREDPSTKIEVPGDPSRIKIAVLHGSYAIEGRYQADDFPISTDVAERLGVDYVAMGHWHRFNKFNDRVYYSGTPEPTSFSEADSGYVLLVEISKPGDKPEVEPIPVKTLDWVVKEIHLDAGSSDNVLKVATDELARLQGKERILLRLIITGYVNPEELSLIESFSNEFSGQFLYLDIQNRVKLVPKIESFENLVGDSPFLKAIIEDLLVLKERTEHSIQSLPQDLNNALSGFTYDQEDVEEALRLLAEIISENGDK